ncbi:uncharacterized protein LOC119737463 isoform X2 [Patiria miniata]|nr:uncharacterized protein LOC119737463 isoform X2 [Patiria miniata]XP_038067776.1 uncharacterized protein LOC119737463 isoform X2 [Patiria miniata]
MNFTRSGRPVYVTLLQEFKRCPPRFFNATVTDRGNFIMPHDPAQINVCDRTKEGKSLFPDTMGGVLVVHTETEFQQLTARLLERPIFFTVSVERHSKQMFSKVTHITKGRLAVFVNTQHPHVHHLIQSRLAQGMDSLKRGKHFAVEFDFNNIFASWMRGMYVSADLQSSLASIHYTAGSGKVTVTSYSEPNECFTDPCSLVLMCMFCLPCCLLTCPCYRIHRAVTVDDSGGEVRGLVASYYSPEAELQGMQQVLAGVLQMLAQNNAAQVNAPPTYDAATGSNLAYGGSQVVNRQPGYPQPVGQQVGYGQPGVQQPGYAVPMVQYPGHAQTVAQQPGYPQPVVGQQPGYARPVVQ